MTRNAAHGRLARTFISDLGRATARSVATTRSGGAVTLPEGLAKGLALIQSACASGRKVIFIGNGGSAAISAHMAIDYWKNGGFPAVTFNEPSLMTCVANDYGFEHLFSEPIKRFAAAGDPLVAISSSGKSRNVINGVEAGRAKKCRVITLSGFDESNPLRALGDLNFYVKSRSYGVVEVAHLTLLHSILEASMLSKSFKPKVGAYW
ncbi:MAG: hypothetical protein A3G34_11725 [Candidatus Lindowbacteria bacterium RIFCSPLOWO2_12_FULL_62_27]|nr:MAG: hypothetical protein A3G34_11725 [Candidatus Lindowbacteria bacterium RIFCSPLOWO2_12_FULL_62_27]